MTVELMTKLLADAEAHFGRPQTAESRASIAEIWAKSPVKDAPDDIAEKAFFDVIWKCTWQNQLLPNWQAQIEKIQGEQVMLARSMHSLKRWRSNRLESAERKKLKQ